MKNIIVGTAGHIDHGKSSLVKALTGIDTDRLKEEKERGISIDLGFANLNTPSGVRIAFVDVPGHERFVRNMLAGVSGIDLVILVIAADEAIKPQTREHFDICRLLAIPAGIVALTKADLVDEEWLSLVRLEVEDFVRGSFLEGAPVIAVSSKSGLGLEAIRQAILDLAVRTPERDSSRLPRLPIDRSFIIKGHGTVITGTLRDGRIQLEDTLEIYPSGKLARVRGIQVHGAKVQQAFAGQRTAINLAGVDAVEIERGFVAATPGAFYPVRIFDAGIQLLSSARLLRDRARLLFHCGTSEIGAELRVLADSRRVAPASAAWVRFVLDQPTILLPGDRFILRSLSPMMTIAGGTVAEIHLNPARLRRKGASERLERWKTLDLPGRILAYVSERPLGMEFAELRHRLGCRESDIPSRIDRLGSWLALPANLKSIGAKIVDRLRAFHKEQPLESGMSREAIRMAFLEGAPAALLETLLRYVPSIKAEGDHLRLESHQVRLAVDEDAAAQSMSRVFAAAGLAVPPLDEVLLQSKLDPARAKAVLALLYRRGELVRITDGLVFHRDALASLKAMLLARKGQRFNVGEFKDWTGVSRKYAIPLLEYLDRERLCRREGEYRIVL